MKRILLIALAVIAGLIAIFLGVAAMQPAEFAVERQTTIDAPPEAVFAEVNDFHRWEHWSPWAKLDPKMKVAYSGPESGKGAKYAWAGNGDVGEGRMEIVESNPHERVAIKLEFLKPMAATNDTSFTFEPKDKQTVVTWKMSGVNGLMGKAMGLFIDMDAMIGGDFEKGLAQLKGAAEKGFETPEGFERQEPFERGELFERPE